MFDYRLLAVDENRRLFPFFVREAERAECVSPQKQQQKMDIEYARTPFEGRRYSDVHPQCVEPHSTPDQRVADVECPARPVVGGGIYR